MRQTVEKPQELSGKICPREVPKEIYPRDLPWANFQTILKAFPLLVRLQATKTKENVSRMSCLNIFWVSRKIFPDKPCGLSTVCTRSQTKPHKVNMQKVGNQKICCCPVLQNKSSPRPRVSKLTNRTLLR